MKKQLNSLIENQSGQGALTMVLILLVLGTLIIGPLLMFMSTGLNAGSSIEERTQEFYAADAGIEDALYKIKHDDLPEWMKGEWGNDTYSEDPYTYSLSDVNSKAVGVSIQPVWVLDGLEEPAPGQGMEPHDSLVTVGDYIGVSDDGTKGEYQIGLIYDGSVGNLIIERIGCWLPAGHEYIDGSSNLEEDPGDDYYCVPTISDFRGGKTIIWDFDNPGIFYDDLPGSAEKKIATFQFTPISNPQGSFSWMRTNRMDIYLSWDMDTKIYMIDSDATSSSGKYTAIEAHTVKNEFRKIGSAIEGDYRATGNTLMIDASGGSPPIRDTLLDDSDAEVDDIPDSATVEAAYLYWSGWLSGDSEQTLFQDDCSDFSNWNAGSDWQIYYGSFDGHHDDGGREITMKNSLDLSSYSDETVTVSWQHWEYGTLEGNDCLQYAFSGNGGSDWGNWNDAFCNDIGSTPVYYSNTIPEEYLTDNFKMRFKIKNFDGYNEWCDIDNIKIFVSLTSAADTSVTFEINGQQVYFDEYGEPAAGAEELVASESSILENEPDEYSYACYRDVTELVQTYSDSGEGDSCTGNGDYTVGGVYGDTGNQWSYAAWSLIIIFSSPDTRGHQLFLYDDFIYSGEDQNVDFNGNGEPGGIISGFLTPEEIASEDYAARITCFVGEGDDYYDGDSIMVNEDYLSNSESDWDNVWNSASPGISEDGIDIDTFIIEYPTISPGDTLAQIDLPTETDSWNLIYMILSFRSDITTGGTMSYILSMGSG